jgi:hypothetical protein
MLSGHVARPRRDVQDEAAHARRFVDDLAHGRRHPLVARRYRLR